jgi:hypothetical protein
MYNKDQMTEQEMEIVEAIVLCFYEHYYDFAEGMYHRDKTKTNHKIFFDFCANVDNPNKGPFNTFSIERLSTMLDRYKDLLDPLTFDLYDECHSVIDDDELEHSMCDWLLKAAREVLVDPMKFVPPLVELIRSEMYSFHEAGNNCGYEDRNGNIIPWDKVNFLDTGELADKGITYHDYDQEEARKYEKKYINILEKLIQ